MIYIKFRPDRTMVIHATGAVRKELQRGLKLDRTNGNSLEAARMEHEILTWLGDSGYPPIPPEAVGALTSAPMVCKDTLSIHDKPTEVWAFTAYEVTTIPAQLANHGFALLEHSEVEYFTIRGYGENAIDSARPASYQRKKETKVMTEYLELLGALEDIAAGDMDRDSMIRCVKEALGRKPR